MMSVSFKRPRGFHLEGRRAKREITSYVRTRLIQALTEFQFAILETPVYTGRTLVNFRWSVGAPNTSTRPAIKEPDLPGRTSDLNLGSEPRRRANAAIVREEFRSLLAIVRGNPFVSIYLNNNLNHFSDVEYGTYAQAGSSSRTPPGGMTRRGETALVTYLEGVIRVSGT